MEEPVPAENVEALAQVRASTSTVICTGENHYTRFQFLESGLGCLQRCHRLVQLGAILAVLELDQELTLDDTVSFLDPHPGHLTHNLGAE